MSKLLIQIFSLIVLTVVGTESPALEASISWQGPAYGGSDRESSMAALMYSFMVLVGESNSSKRRAHYRCGVTISGLNVESNELFIAGN